MATLCFPPTAGAKGQRIDVGRRLMIIGANGAGKTRFSERLIADNADAPAFRISVLSALYPDAPADSLAGSIDSLYAEATARAPFLRSDAPTRLERMVALMIYDEIFNLLAHKLNADVPAPLPISRLDRVVAVWQEIFPGNRVLRESGRVLFARHEEDSYPAMRLSEGEKAVLYYLGAALMAPDKAVIFVDKPGLFLHPSVTTMIWDRVEALRPDCTWVYTTHDVDFLASRAGSSQVVWVRGYDAVAQTWDYALLPPSEGLSEEIYSTLVGARKPVLFIEGDGKNSIDAKLYPLIFQDYTVRSLGSCNKVVEAVRTFNDLGALHHLDSYGVVDRDRRSAQEVNYLREKKIFVPNVAEIENILMLEPVIRVVARRHGKNDDRVFQSVKKAVIAMFKHDLHAQAMEHTRHRVKRTMEYRVDARFANINQMEQHLQSLPAEINPRALYERLCREFSGYVAQGDYESVLRVYNQKSMLPHSNVAGLCGLNNKEAYISEIIHILRDGGRDAESIRRAIIACFGIDQSQANAPRPNTIDHD